MSSSGNEHNALVRMLFAWAGGSTGWQAPEQLLLRSGGEARLGRSVDIFTFGLLLFYCLTGGQHPFGEGIERDYRILNVSSQNPGLDTLSGPPPILIYPSPVDKPFSQNTLGLLQRDILETPKHPSDICSKRGKSHG